MCTAAGQRITRSDVTQSTPELLVFRLVVAMCATGHLGVNACFAVHDISVAFLHSRMDVVVSVHPPRADQLVRAGFCWRLRRSMNWKRMALTSTCCLERRLRSRWCAPSLATPHPGAVRELREQGSWNHRSQPVRLCESLEQDHRVQATRLPVAHRARAVTELMGVAYKPASQRQFLGASAARGSKTAQESGCATLRASLMMRSEAHTAAQQARFSVTHGTDPTSSFLRVVACQGFRALR